MILIILVNISLCYTLLHNFILFLIVQLTMDVFFVRNMNSKNIIWLIRAIIIEIIIEKLTQDNHFIHKTDMYVDPVK